MKLNLWLIVDSKGRYKVVKKADPSVGTVSLNLKINIPDSLFPKPKQFPATIEIQDNTKTEHSVDIKITS